MMFLTNIMVYWRLGVLAIVLLAVGFIEIKIYSFGYNKASAKYLQELAVIQKETDLEIAKEAAANKTALLNANKQIEDLNTEQDNLNKELTDNDEAIAKDRASANKCLAAASLHRLNAISGHSSSGKSAANRSKVH